MTAGLPLKLRMFHHANAPLADGLTRDQLLRLSDHDFETRHGFIQWAFPTPYPSATFSNAPVLSLQDARSLADAPDVIGFIEDMTQRYINVLSRSRRWIAPHDHNHLRITRVLTCLRFLHGWDLADWFHRQVVALCGDEMARMDTAAAHWQAQVTPRHDRAAGAFVGLAIGDALGAAVTGAARGSFAPLTGFRAGGRLGLGAGAWTDETAMALCLAESLLARETLDPADLLTRFCAWAETGVPSSTGKAVDLGQTTLRSLGDFRRSGRLEALPAGANSDGNGSLARTAPIACYWQDDLTATREAAIAQSRTTHASALAERACDFLAELTLHLMGGLPYDQSKSRALARHKGPRLYTELSVDFHGMPADQIASGGYVLDTLRAALWAVENTTSFDQAVLLAANLGNEADTTAAIAGQIAGARYGYSAVPLALRRGLVQERLLYVTSQFLSRAGAARPA